MVYFQNLVWKSVTFLQKVVVLLLKKPVLSVRSGFFLSWAPVIVGLVTPEMWVQRYTNTTQMGSLDGRLSKSGISLSFSRQ